MALLLRLAVALLCITFSAAQDCTTGTTGILRLTGGGSYYGRVEICIAGEWGGVCRSGYYWRYQNSVVACRQLGFDNPDAYRGYINYGQGTVSVIVAELQCTGTESSLLSCDHADHVTSCSSVAGIQCLHYADTCTEEDIRLVDGLVSTEGRVEVCRNGRWTGICDTNWNYQDAFVVCRQLGFPATDAYPRTSAYFGLGVNPNLTDFLCYGNESQLLNCQYSEGSCSVYDSVGVQCRGEVVTDTGCIDGTLRLASGSDANEGRVEVCSNRLWATVCGGGYWDSRDATVVCSQLGYQNATVSVYSHSSTFGQGDGPILLAGLNCDGSEHSIQDCSTYGNTPEFCTHSNDVGVRCEIIDPSVIEPCTDGGVRLVGGEDEAEGRVELCIGNVWGSVCSNSWDIHDGAVVCQQLGYQGANVSIYYNSHFGEGRGPYHGSYGCDGDEPNLLSCYQYSSYNCKRNEDAGVKCDALQCTNGSVRLLDGSMEYEGRVEICHNGQWGAVCGYSYSGLLQVACRQLFGSNATGAAIDDYFFYYYDYNDGGSGVPILYDFACDETATRVSDCTYFADYDLYSGYCYGHYGDLRVRCYEYSGCTSGDVRLADGKHHLEGRVELCQDGVWGAVTDYYDYYGWTVEDAMVTCRQLGFPSEWAIALSTDSPFGRGNVPILTRTNCSGNEDNLTDCSHYTVSVSEYYYSDPAVASVICQGNTSSHPECPSGEVRLIDGSRAEEGRVELCHNGFWRTICDQNWSQEDAVVVCTQLGLPKLGAQPFSNASFGEGNVPVLGYIKCLGRERKLEECVLTELSGTVNCHHGRDVGVICQDAAVDYPVSVSVSKPHEGRTSMGSTITLHCNVEPEPSQGTTYVWSSSVNGFTYYSHNSTTSTFIVPVHHPSIGHYYCHVYYNGTQIGVGSTTVEVTGLVYPAGVDHFYFSVHENITLNVVVNPISKVFYNFRTLTWFHNGNQLHHGERVAISEDHTELAIYDTSETDGGVYEARFTGLVIQPYSRSCEAGVLDLLAHYPVLRAAVFHLTTGQEAAGDIEDFHYPADISFTEDQDVVYFTESDNVTLVFQGSVPPSFEETVTTVWTLNGQSLSTEYGLGPLRGPLLSISQTLTIEDANFLAAGEYIASLEISPYTHFVEHLQCPNEYYQLVSSTLGITSVTLGQAAIQLKYGSAPGESDSDTHSESKSGSNASAIAGGVVGGVVLAGIVIVTVLIVVICVLARKKRHSAGSLTPETSTSNPAYATSVHKANLKEQSRYHSSSSKPPKASARYTSATGAVQMGPKEDYEDMEYQEEGIYEDPDKLQ